MKKNSILTVLTLLLALHSFAQEKLLSMDEALQLAISQNRDIELKEVEVKSALMDYKKTNKVFLPKITLSETGVSTNNPLNSFGILLQQERVTAADFNPDKLNNPEDISNWNTRGAIEMPLFNLDGIYGRKASKEVYNAKIQEAKRLQEFILFEVKQHYYMLSLAKDQQIVLEEAIATVEEAMKVVENNKANGYAKQSDVLQVKVRKLDLQSKLEEAKDGVASVNDYLVYLLRLPENTTIEIEDKLTALTTNVAKIEQEHVSLVRSDLMAMNFAVEAQKNMWKMNKSKFAPRINAFGQYDFNDQYIFGTTAQSYLVGVSLSWTIYDGGNQIATSQQAKLNWEKATLNLEKEKSKADIELKKSQRKVVTAKTRIEMAEMAKEEAQESYRILSDRYSVGLEKTLDLLAAETVKSEKELAYLNAVFTYNMAVFHLDLLVQE
ncbi:TolC family protein [Flammeovirga kamogawensis]|uniref:TolC family protein n=1 Tax=Flammeovirga kamogawensis TaxID=373891 RepID=A0ABX8H5G7_9BACT|nr:TolC family protein [Flammeovirga kamogawensis]MBB6461761.1 outer membrane protein TolC [Flammeovirga kamogawensis]QWG10677.1 TolC family protein [Flammeovirga kamogawensis]TRX63780.1 TolC family protein [Flammeovirga kamogawensis]